MTYEDRFQVTHQSVRLDYVTGNLHIQHPALDPENAPMTDIIGKIRPPLGFPETPYSAEMLTFLTKWRNTRHDFANSWEYFERSFQVVTRKSKNMYGDPLITINGLWTPSGQVIKEDVQTITIVVNQYLHAKYRQEPNFDNITTQRLYDSIQQEQIRKTFSYLYDIIIEGEFLDQDIRMLRLLNQLYLADVEIIANPHLYAVNPISTNHTSTNHTSSEAPMPPIPEPNDFQNPEIQAHNKRMAHVNQRIEKMLMSRERTLKTLQFIQNVRYYPESDNPMHAYPHSFVNMGELRGQAAKRKALDRLVMYGLAYLASYPRNEVGLGSHGRYASGCGITPLGVRFLELFHEQFEEQVHTPHANLYPQQTTYAMQTTYAKQEEFTLLSPSRTLAEKQQEAAQRNQTTNPTKPTYDSSVVLDANGRPEVEGAELPFIPNSRAEHEKLMEYRKARKAEREEKARKEAEKTREETEKAKPVEPTKSTESTKPAKSTESTKSVAPSLENPYVPDDPGYDLDDPNVRYDAETGRYFRVNPRDFMPLSLSAPARGLSTPAELTSADAMPHTYEHPGWIGQTGDDLVMDGHMATTQSAATSNLHLVSDKSKEDDHSDTPTLAPTPTPAPTSASIVQDPLEGFDLLVPTSPDTLPTSTSQATPSGVGHPEAMPQDQLPT